MDATPNNDTRTPARYFSGFSPWVLQPSRGAYIPQGYCRVNIWTPNDDGKWVAIKRIEDLDAVLAKYGLSSPEEWRREQEAADRREIREAFDIVMELDDWNVLEMRHSEDGVMCLMNPADPSPPDRLGKRLTELLPRLKPYLKEFRVESYG